MPSSLVPEIRVHAVNSDPINADGHFVLYWMTANRRLEYNFSLDRAVEHCIELNKPLVILEGLRCDYEWASDRLHKFVIDGMNDNFQVCESYKSVYYLPYLEPKKSAGKGMLQALAEQSCVVIGDEFPCFFLPRMIKAAAKQISVRFECVDSNGLLPMRAAEGKTFTVAHSFRRFLQKTLRPHLQQMPQENPLGRLGQSLKPEKNTIKATASHLKKINKKWPSASAEALSKPDLASFPIDHTVTASKEIIGGRQAAAKKLELFLKSRLKRYDDERNDPDASASSELSPYFHFGHVSAHEVFARLTRKEKWKTSDLAEKANGKRNGWWNMSEVAEAFLDEFITWREIGYNMCFLNENYDQLDSLPEWAQKTIAEHKDDKRPEVYSLKQLEQAKTSDDIWNAAQRELVQTGRMHNYLRMLWGKKIYQWSPDAQTALESMIELNNKYALDGRNPNSYSGIFWVLGRYDRAWGPERKIFGKLRYMTSDSTRKKIKLKEYLKTYGG